MGEIDFRLIMALSGHQWSVQSVAVTKDSGYILSGSLDQTVRVWDYNTGQCTKILQDPTRRVLLPLSKPYRSQETMAMENNVLPQRNGDPTWEIYSVVPTPDGKYVVAGCSDGTVRVWNLVEGDLVHRLWGHGGVVYSVAASPNGLLIASAATDGTVRLWDLPLGIPRAIFTMEKDIINTLTFMPDGRQLVGGSMFHHIYVWELGTPNPTQIFAAHESSVRSVAVTPDGRSIISGGFNNLVKVWDFPSGRLLHVLSGHTDVINSVAVTADGQYIVTGSGDSTTRVWDIATGKELQVFHEPGGAIYAVAPTPDGGCVISGSNDCTLHVWARAGFIKPEWANRLQSFKKVVPQFAHTIDKRKILDSLEKPSSLREIIKRVGMKDGRELPYLSMLLSDLERQGKISKELGERGIIFYHKC